MGNRERWGGQRERSIRPVSLSEPFSLFREAGFLPAARTNFYYELRNVVNSVGVSFV